MCLRETQTCPEGRAHGADLSQRQAVEAGASRASSRAVRRARGHPWWGQRLPAVGPSGLELVLWSGLPGRLSGEISQADTQELQAFGELLTVCVLLLEDGPRPVPTRAEILVATDGQPELLVPNRQDVRSRAENLEGSAVALSLTRGLQDAAGFTGISRKRGPSAELRHARGLWAPRPLAAHVHAAVRPDLMPDADRPPLSLFGRSVRPRRPALG